VGGVVVNHGDRDDGGVVVNQTVGLFVVNVFKFDVCNVDLGTSQCNQCYLQPMYKARGVIIFPCHLKRSFLKLSQTFQH